MHSWTVILDQADIRPAEFLQVCINGLDDAGAGALVCVRIFCTFIKAVLARKVIKCWNHSIYAAETTCFSGWR